MSILDDDDPVSVLSARLITVLDKQDGATAIAALASVLGSMLDYAASKTSLPPPRMFTDLHEHLIRLVTEIVRAREVQKHERS